MEESTENNKSVDDGIDRLWAQLASPDTSLFAILDSCDEPRILQRVEELGASASCLYRGQAKVDHNAIAPYLAIVDRDLFGWIIRELADTPWGILGCSSATLIELRKHFRKFLMVEDPDGNELYFRFYDPRVLPTFVENCNADEKNEFFGPVDRFATLNADGEVRVLNQT